MTLEMQKIDGLNVEWRNKIKNKDKNKKRIILKLLKI
jgi:hypothetical protein